VNIQKQKTYYEKLANELCSYGCNQKANFILKNGKPCCSDSQNKCSKMRENNRAKNKIRKCSLCNVCKQMISNTCYKQHKNNCNLTENNIADAKKYFSLFVSWSEIKRKTGLRESEMRKIFKNEKRSLTQIFKVVHALNKTNSWIHKESYAEKFFNNFLISEGFVEGKDYIREYQVSFYRIDFFFQSLNIAIEIDGQQHVRLRHQIDIDRRKNLFLREQNVEVIRLFWKDMFQDTKEKLSKIANYLKGQQVDISIIVRKLEYPDNSEIIIQKINKNKEMSIKKHIKILITCLKKVLKKRPKIKKREENSRNVFIIRKELLINSNIDFFKNGWLAKLSRLWNVSHTHAKRHLKEYFPEVKYKIRKKCIV
jgi:very-short-patch-repair endonuclease